MKFSAILCLCAAVVAALPLSAQSRSSRTKARSSKPAVTISTTAEAGEEVEKEAKTGVRFIMCPVGGAKLPSKLYYKDGKEYKSTRIGTRRPSPRMKASNGEVEFWDKDPAEAEAAKEKEPKPVLSIDVPAGSKMLGIIIPNKDVDKSKTLFLDEKEFPKKGIHIVNLSPYVLKMTLSSKGDFSDKKESHIGPYRGSGISSENSWNFKGDKSGEQVSFMLAYKKSDAKGYTNLKASRFMVTSGQSQINFVVKEPNSERPKLLSTQLD